MRTPITAQDLGRIQPDLFLKEPLPDVPTAWAFLNDFVAVVALKAEARAERLVDFYVARGGKNSPPVIEIRLDNGVETFLHMEKMAVEPKITTALDSAVAIILGKGAGALIDLRLHPQDEYLTAVKARMKAPTLANHKDPIRLQMACEILGMNVLESEWDDVFARMKALSAATSDPNAAPVPRPLLAEIGEALDWARDEAQDASTYANQEDRALLETKSKGFQALRDRLDGHLEADGPPPPAQGQLTEAAHSHIEIHRFGNTPSLAYEEGELLSGFDADALSGEDYETPRAAALYATLDTSIQDEEMALGALPDGRWALVGLTVEGHSFAVETEKPEGGPS